MPCAVILTAIPIEYQAVRSHLTQLLEVMHPQGTIYERGKFLTEGKIWDIGIVETGAGNSPAGIEAERAIAFFKPDVILFVGVAGGIKDVKLGDVVAGTKVYGYESGKLEGEKFKPRPNVGESSYNLVQRARFEAKKNDWLERVSIQSDLNPTVFVAPIAAGEKVVADVKSDLFQFLRDNYGDGLAVEMEGLGVLKAAYANQQVSALIIRGISDLIEGKSEADKSGFQEIAAHHASAFAFQILAKFEPPQEENMSNPNPNDSSREEGKVTNNYNFQGANFGGGFAGGDYQGDVSNNLREKNLLVLDDKGIPSNVPLNTKNFVGREDELTRIHEILETSQGVLVCAVEGLGGIGKSALALRYAEEYKDCYSRQYWIGLQVSDLATEVVKFASNYLQIPESFIGESLATQSQWYWNHWLPQEGNLLVILDNVWESESIPEAALPKHKRIKVLVTTRERNLNVQFESFPLEMLPLDKCEELLGKIVGKERVEKEKQIVAKICETVGFLPLGVELLGEYLSKKRYLNFAKLQAELNIKHDALNQKREYKEIGNLGVIAAIDLTWQNLTTASQKVGMLLSVFAPTETLWELIEVIGQVAEITEEELETAREELDNFHLIKPVNEDCDFYTVHPLVREFFALQLTDAADKKSLYQQAFINHLLSVAKNIPQALTVERVKQLDPIIPHLQHLSEMLLDEIPNPEDNLFWVFNGIGRYYEGQGQYDLAEVPYERCVREVKSRLGEESEDYSASLNNLARLYYSQGRYSEAEPLYIRALSIKEQQLGESHPSTATSLNNLAELYRSQGRYSEAEPLLTRALSIYEQQLGENHPYTATSLNNLAALYDSQGRYSEAEPLYIRALSIREQQLGENYPDTALSLNNLAGLYNSQGRYSEAEPLLTRALSITEQQLGENHPYTASSLNNLAGLYDSQGRYSEAEPLLTRALSITEQQLGENHPYTASSLNNLAALYDSQGRYSEAEPLYIRALSIREQQLGKNHPDTALSLNNLAELYYSQGRYSEAEPLYIRAISICQTTLGNEHPNTQTMIENYQIMLSQRQPVKRSFLRSLLNILGVVVGIILLPFYYVWLGLRWLINRLRL